MSMCVRRLSLPAHAPAELSAGLALVVSALVLSLDVAGFLALLVAGVTLAGNGLRGALPLAVAGGLVPSADRTGQNLLTAATRGSRRALAGS